jgi:hypothetical protein
MSHLMRFPPPCPLFRGQISTEHGRDGVPVRKSEDKAMFIRMLGARHTIESAMDIPPAARRRKSMNAQVAINPLDTIVIVGCHYHRKVSCAPHRDRYNGAHRE